MLQHLDANGVSGFGPELQLVSHNHVFHFLQNALKLFIQPPALLTLDHDIGKAVLVCVCVCVGGGGRDDGGVRRCLCCS